MTPEMLLFLTAAIFIVAVLYSSVGHGGASGYIAALTLFSVAPDAFKPTALTLNILVASVAAYSFARAGQIPWRLFCLFAATSVPCSFIGGMMALPPHFYKPLVGAVLIFAAARLVFHKEKNELATNPPSAPAALVVGTF